MSSSPIDASNVDLHELIRAMWSAAPVASFFRYTGMPVPPAPTNADIDKALTSGRDYIDYLCGRPIKTDFSDRSRISPAGFDRDAGGYNSNSTGALALIVAELRAASASE